MKSTFGNHLLKCCIALLCLLFSITGTGWAQTKYEKEVCIRRDKVPEAALNFVDAIQPDKRVKWYQETGIDRTTIEAKTKYHGQKHSIEFDAVGVFEDVEIEVSFSELSTNVRSSIENHLVTQYGKFEVEKVQYQFEGDRNLIIDLLKTGQLKAKRNPKYELIVIAKVDGVFKKYEYLFSETGAYLQSSEIVLKRLENIEY